MRIIQAEEVQHIVSKLIRYIDSKQDIFDNFKISDNYYSCIQIKNVFHDFEILADIALKLLSAAIDKASHEKAIKKQRIIQTLKKD